MKKHEAHRKSFEAFASIMASSVNDESFEKGFSYLLVRQSKILIVLNVVIY